MLKIPMDYAIPADPGSPMTGAITEGISYLEIRGTAHDGRL
jgi:hypothetical protein